MMPSHDITFCANEDCKISDKCRRSLEHLNRLPRGTTCSVSYLNNKKVKKPEQCEWYYEGSK